MSKTLSKALALVLALCMVLALCACGNTAAPAESSAPVETETETTETAPAPVEVDNRLAAEAQASLEDIDIEAYTEKSAEVYDLVLGEFYAAYLESLSAETISERYALMAVAEAKMLEAGIFFPTSSNGGNYAIGRTVNYSVTPTLYGNDEYRLHGMMVVTEPITSEDRVELKALWNEVRGTGTYQAEAKALLESKGYTFKDSYSRSYSSDPKTWDWLATSRQADTEPLVNLFEGLMEYDVEGTQQPALATGVEMSEDGLTYTFTLREASWVDSQGRKVADLKADDFVAGMQHLLDAKGGVEYLLGEAGCNIVNADAYANGEVTDFAEVGIKALDDRTVEYTLEAPCPFFLTMLSYTCFAPMSRDYYVSQGGTFGEEYDPSAASYLYGKGPDSIAYCGPYVVTNWTAENTIVFAENKSYWNADARNVSSITWLYNDGQDATKAYYDMQAGTLDSCGLNASALEVAKADGWFDQYVYTTATDATAFVGFFNVNRANYANVNDATAVVSPMTVTDSQRTAAAMLNQHFRLAIAYALDRLSYNAQTVGDELAAVSLINSYTPGNFVMTSEEVTLPCGTFAAGTYYGEIMQAQLEADGMSFVVWDGVNAQSSGFDGWYNPEAAAAELALAVEELAAQGIEVSAENPIYIDLPYFSGSTAYAQRANVLKQSVEAASNGAIIVNLTECVDSSTWYYAGYYTDYGFEANYTVYDVSGWGPDYGDPQTYLATMLPDYAGYMVKCLGIF